MAVLPFPGYSLNFINYGTISDRHFQHFIKNIIETFILTVKQLMILFARIQVNKELVKGE